MNDIDYKKFYDKIGKRIGWDFSQVKSVREGVKWDFFKEVAKKLKPTDKLLDIGTGGGEKVLTIADETSQVVGIDLSASMIKTAKDNLKKSKNKNVRFVKMNAFDLKFPNKYFDIITSKHCDFSINEVYRVLKKGGYFFTQQVGEKDKLNIKYAFGRGQSYKKIDGALMKRYLKELKKEGFRNIKSYEYNATDYYKTPKDLVFVLKHTPIIPEFGTRKKDFVILEKFIKENSTPKGIKTNSKRFMITARK